MLETNKVVPTNKYINDRSTRTRCETCSKFYFVEILFINERNLDSSYPKNDRDIKRSKSENKYMFKVNSRNTRKRCDMFKVNSNSSRAMTSFCSGAGRTS